MRQYTPMNTTKMKEGIYLDAFIYKTEYANTIIKEHRIKSTFFYIKEIL